MPEFTAKDVQAPPPGHRRRDDGRQEGPRRRTTATSRPPRSGCARRAWPRSTSSVTARTRRARWPSVVDGNVGAVVELKSETDFSAKADDFTSLVQDLAELVRGQGRRRRLRAGHRARGPQDRQEGEHRAGHGRAPRGGRRQPARLLPPHPGRSWRQRRAGRAGRRHPRAGPRHRRAHRLRQAAVPAPATRCPADAVEKERQALLEITKAEGKPEQAWPKIVDGRLNAWYKDQVLLEQGFVRDDKTTIAQLLGDATLVRFAQVFIGA